jgi:metallo-beta-lactamase family protein
MKGAKVIIAGSGMMTGGRIIHHAKDYLPRPNTRILFVGYQAEDTLGRKILEGAKQVEIDERTVKVNAKIREIDSMSSHADQSKLLNWIGHIKGVQKVILTHGEESQRNTLAEKIRSDIRLSDITLPLKDQEDILY